MNRSLVTLVFSLGVVFAQRVGAPTDDLDKLSADELFSVQVTSVGRKAQQLSRAPAAVFVLTAEDIRRSGATSIPEALERVPGLTVLRIDGRSWAVSARGANRLYSNRMLVMIDGRSLYMPLFSGVIWDTIDLPLEDVEQIEIVRGPGAVMWGPNAVNGVVNIITRRAHATKGALVSASTGNELRGAAAARWGAIPNDKIALRFWGKMDYRMPAYSSPGIFYFDTFSYRDPSIRNLDSATGRLGFRFDGQPGPKDQWMIQGDVYKLERQDANAYPAILPSVDRVQGHTDYEGGYVQGRWTRTNSTGNESVWQFSYDKNNINYPFISGRLNNLTVDYQKRWQTGERNEVYAGIGYQQYWDSTASQRFLAFDPARSVYRTGDIVLRDELQIVPGRLMGSAGVRVDYGSLHRVEYQPSVRLLYTPNARQSAWVAASRAVRVPDRLDRDLRYDNGQFDADGIPLSMLIFGTTAARSEIERSWEAGYRLQSGQHWSVDSSVFWSHYSRLRTLQSSGMPEMVAFGPTQLLAVPMWTDNSGAGHSYGGEIWGTWQANGRWRLSPSYSYVRDILRLPVNGDRLFQWDRTPSDLRNQATLRSQHDLPLHLQLDLMARARSRDVASGTPGVLLFDARLGWRPVESGELSFSVANLTNRHVIESLPEAVIPSIPIRRTFVLKWTQRF